MTIATYLVRFVAWLLALALSRIMGASVRFRVGGWKCLRDVVVKFKKMCHIHGVMHRDLKPENFLFANKKENGALKAIDFGLSVFFKPGKVDSSSEELRDALNDDVDSSSEEVANAFMHDVDTDKDGKISYEEFAAMMKAGTYWRKASRQYSRERFNSLSLKLIRDGSLQARKLF